MGHCPHCSGSPAVPVRRGAGAALNKRPEEFQPRAERDALDAWQLPRGSKNLSLVILAPNGSETRLELGPLPAPAS